MNTAINSNSATQHKTRERLDALCKWIDANIDRRIDWTELVQVSGMGHVELQNQFSTYFKTSPMQWIRVRRHTKLQEHVDQLEAQITLAKTRVIALEQSHDLKPN